MLRMVIYWNSKSIIQDVEDLDETRRNDVKMLSTKLRAMLWRQSQIAAASINI